MLVSALSISVFRAANIIHIPSAYHVTLSAAINCLISLQDYHLSRLLGFSVYLPVCPFTALPTLWTAAFGFLPSVLATITVVVYVIW